MSNPDDKPLPAVGVYWIREEDYPAVRAMFTDGHKMPPVFADWLKMAVEMENGLKSYGHPVMRVTVDPGTFPGWCAAHGTTPDREGRKRFVAAAVTERYGDQR